MQISMIICEKQRLHVMHNLIRIKIFKCFLVTCGRLKQLQHEKGDQGVRFISGGGVGSLLQTTMQPPTRAQTCFHARSTGMTCWETSQPCIKSNGHPQRHQWLHRFQDIVVAFFLPAVLSVCVVVSESEVMQKTIHPHTSTP